MIRKPSNPKAFRTAPPPPNVGGISCPTIITGGSSITATGGYVTTTGQAPNQDDNWFNWARGFTGPRFVWLRNAAVGGETIRQQINRLDTEVFPYAPQYFNFVETSNSINTYVVTGGLSYDLAIAATIADLDELVNKVLRQGIKLILMTVKPRNDYDLARNAAHEKVNQWKRWRASFTPGIILVDIWKVVVDPTSANMFAKTNYLKASDNLHFTPKGARAVGYEWAQVMDAYLPDTMLYVSDSNTFHKAQSAYAKRMNVNAFFTGSGGSVVGANVSGTIASGVRAGCSGTVASTVCSLVARADGRGNNQRLVTTGGTTGSSNYSFVGTVSADANAHTSGADYLRGMVQVSLTGMTNVKGFNPYITTTIDGLTKVQYGFNNMAASAAEYDQTDLVGFWVDTPNANFGGTTVTASSLGLRVDYIAAGGAVTLDVGRMEYLNLGPNMMMY